MIHTQPITESRVEEGTRSKISQLCFRLLCHDKMSSKMANGKSKMGLDWLHYNQKIDWKALVEDYVHVKVNMEM